jgi:hypothetical protein
MSSIRTQSATNVQCLSACRTSALQLAPGLPVVKFEIERYMLSHGKRRFATAYGNRWFETSMIAVETTPHPLDHRSLAEAAGWGVQMMVSFRKVKRDRSRRLAKKYANLDAGHAARREQIAAPNQGIETGPMLTCEVDHFLGPVITGG